MVVFVSPALVESSVGRYGMKPRLLQRMSVPSAQWHTHNCPFAFACAQC